MMVGLAPRASPPRGFHTHPCWLEVPSLALWLIMVPARITKIASCASSLVVDSLSIFAVLGL